MNGFYIYRTDLDIDKAKCYMCKKTSKLNNNSRMGLCISCYNIKLELAEHKDFMSISPDRRQKRYGYRYKLLDGKEL